MATDELGCSAGSEACVAGHEQLVCVLLLGLLLGPLASCSAAGYALLCAVLVALLTDWCMEAD